MPRKTKIATATRAALPQIQPELLDQLSPGR
jgi:hypothetical protein